MRIRFSRYTFSYCNVLIKGSVTSFLPQGHVDWGTVSLSLTLNSVFVPMCSSPPALLWNCYRRVTLSMTQAENPGSLRHSPLPFLHPLNLISHLLVTTVRKDTMVINVSLPDATKELRYHHH